ncbi:MAG TPA: hypothetical protein VGM53_34615 [Streptosporangiaceae bacterium]|jgi:hypothetical protein
MIGQAEEGAILSALTIIEATGRGDEMAVVRAAEIADLVKAWGTSALTQAFALLIYAAMSAIRPPEGDNLHVMVPAVLTRLSKIESAKPFVPTMAGVLTAAATGEDIWQWRATLGPVGGAELQAWCWTTWLLADFLDKGHGEPGKFAREAAQIVTRDADNNPE